MSKFRIGEELWLLDGNGAIHHGRVISCDDDTVCVWYQHAIGHPWAVGFWDRRCDIHQSEMDADTMRLSRDQAEMYRQRASQ